MKPIAAFVGVAVGLLATAAQAREGAALHCPDSGLHEVLRRKPIPDLLTALVPPLAFINLIANDSLAKLPTRKVSFRVVDEAGRAVPKALVGIIHRESNRFLAEGAAGGPPIKLPHGQYVINAAIQNPDRSVRYGMAEVDVGANAPASVTVVLKHRAEALQVKPLAPSGAVGSVLAPEVTGALREKVRLVVRRPAKDKDGAPEEVSDTAIADGETPEVLLPGRAGRYDIVGILCAPRLLLARWSVTAKPARIAIEAPRTAPMGSAVTVVLSGTLNPAYTVEIAPESGSSLLARALTADARQTFDLTLPYRPGRHEVTVQTRDNAVLARQTLTVTFAPMTIVGPDRIRLGDKAKFGWPKDGSSEFKLEIWTLAGAQPARRLGEVRDQRAIAGPGTYELRLVRWADRTEVLGRKTFSVEGQAFDTVPTVVAAGSRVSVKMALDVDFFDKLYFYKRGAQSEYGLSLSRSTDPRTMTAEAPTEPGAYDLVYLIGAVSGRIEAGRVPIEVR